MSNYPQYLLNSIIGSSGNYVIPPETADEAGAGRLSQQEGWGGVNQLPLKEGGIAPFREDFNGLAFLLSQFLVWYQQGGIMNYSSSLDYEPGNEVLQNGVKYRCLVANGPGTSPVVPGNSPNTWKNMDNNVPAGSVIPFYNVTLGGSDGRRPVFWGQQNADESWVLCDGGSDGQDGNVPNLIDFFVMGATVANAGETGGASSQTLSADQLPAHTHTITVNSAGSHTHTRGTMEITGYFGTEALVSGSTGTHPVGGAFSTSVGENNHISADTEQGATQIDFTASKSWTGVTSSSGSHTHTASCSSTGSGSASISTLPPFYKMAYFVKLPE